MANFTMIHCCLLVSLLLVASVECGETTTLTVQPNEIKPNAGLMSYILELPVTISRALDRIRQSTRNYRLMNDIWFEVIPENTNGINRKKSASKSPPRNLVEQADAVFDTHRLSWHNAIVQGLDLNIYKDQMQRYTFDIIKQTQNANDFHTQAGTRTFGFQRRRLQLVMLPVMYKLGVITTLLIGLTVLSVKGVTIGVLLLVLAVAGVVAKVSKYHHQYGPYTAAAAYTHDPYDRVASQHQLLQQPTVSHEKNIHVHVHTAPGSSASLSSWPNRGNNHAMLKSSLVYNGGRAPTGDDNVSYEPYYWNRNNEDYYDAATNNDNNNYHLNNRRVGNSDNVESTTNNIYPWLG